MASDNPQCWCHTFAIGTCSQCGAPVCGDHSSLHETGRFCAEHLPPTYLPSLEELAAQGAARGFELERRRVDKIDQIREQWVRDISALSSGHERAIRALLAFWGGGSRDNEISAHLPSLLAAAPELAGDLERATDPKTPVDPNNPVYRDTVGVAAWFAAQDASVFKQRVDWVAEEKGLLRTKIVRREGLAFKMYVGGGGGSRYVVSDGLVLRENERSSARPGGDLHWSCVSEMGFALGLDKDYPRWLP